jgi:hypothetical protein
MGLRRALHWWSIPAAFLLPMWLIAGWIIAGAGAGALAWVLILGAPAVFVGQLLVALLMRLRPSVRSSRAASWWDVGGMAVWHLLVVAMGLFDARWWAEIFIAALFAGAGLIVLEVWQLGREWSMRWSDTVAAAGRSRPRRGPTDAAPVFVVEERRPD